MGMKGVVSLLSCVFVAVFAVAAFGTVEWNLQHRINTDTPPLDVAVSLNGRWIYVLNDRGEILVYTEAGVLRDTLEVGKHVDRIAVGVRDDLLIVSSRQTKTVETIQLDFIRTIGTIGSPYRGPEDAPVAIAVFTDFQ